MLYCLKLQHCVVNLCLGGLLLFLAGLHQVEAAAAATEMANLNWKPFIYGGMASIVAEFGRLRDAPLHAAVYCHACCWVKRCYAVTVHALLKLSLKSHEFAATGQNLQEILPSDGNVSFKKGTMPPAESYTRYMYIMHLQIYAICIN